MSTAITATTITTISVDPAEADMNFNASQSRWGTTQTGADQVGTGGFYSLGNDPSNRVFTTSSPIGMNAGIPIFGASTRVIVGGAEASVPQAAGIHSFAFGNMGVIASPTAYQEVANYNLSAGTGQTSDLNSGDYAKLVFDVTNDQDLNYLAAMGNVKSMTIDTIGDEADGNKQVTIVMQIVDTVASAADPNGDIVSAAGALSFSMNKNAAGTAQALTPDQGKTIFQTDFFYQDLTIPTLDPNSKTVAIRANGVLGVEGTFTALIPETTIAAVGLDPQSVGGSSDAGVPDGFSFSQNGAQTINGQTYYSYSIKNSAWSEHDLQFGQSTGNTIIDTIIADQGTPYALVKEGSGTLSLTGNNTFTGGVTVAGGTLSLQHDNAAGTGDITTTGSTVDYADGVNISNPLNINSNTTKLQVLTGSAEQSGVISQTAGPRPLEKIGAGTLILSAANTYSGTTIITEGTLVAGVAGALGATNSDVAINGGTLDLGGMYHTKQDVVQTAGVIQNGGLTVKTYARTGGSASATISADISVVAMGGIVNTIGTNGIVATNATSDKISTFNRVAINNSTGLGVDTHATGSGGISNLVYGTVSGINTGILSRTTTGNIDINVGRNVSGSGNSASGGSTYNTVASGIWAETTSGEVNIHGVGDVTSTGNGSRTINVITTDTNANSSNDVIINMSGTITNSGTGPGGGLYTRGIYVDRRTGGSGTVEITTGDINITNATNGNASAVSASQSGDGAFSIDTTAGTLTVNGTATAGGLIGVNAGSSGSGGIDIKTGKINIIGGTNNASYGGIGILASTSSAGAPIDIETFDKINGGQGGIRVFGLGSSGATGDVTINTRAKIGDVTQPTDYGIQVRAENGATKIHLGQHEDGTLVTSGAADLKSGGIGILTQVKGSGSLEIDTRNQTITAGDTGIQVIEHNSGQIDINSGAVSGTSHGIIVNAGTGVKNVTTHGDTTGGTNGISVENSSATGKVTIVANANVTGQSQRGINVITGSGDVDISSTAGTIKGQSNGLVASTTSGKVNIDVAGNVVGVNGDALAGLSTSGNVVVNGAGNVTGNYRAISANTKGNITISGTGKSTVNGPGINANNVGAITATIGGVTADSTILINRSGAVSNLSNQNVKGIYAINNSTGAGDITIANDGGTGIYGSVVVDGNNNSASVGIYAERHNATGGGDITIDSGDVTVNGAIGFGIEGLGYDVSNVNITNHGIVNGGHIGVGGFTYGTGNVTINTDAEIGNVTSPTSYAILARADGSGDVSITANNAVASAGTAISVDNLSNGGSGNVAISGTGAVSGVTRGIQAQTNGGAISITGSGEISASGAGSNSIYAKSASGGANDLTINRTGSIINTGAGNAKGIVAQHLGAGSGNLNITTGAGGITIGGQSGAGISAYRDATLSGAGGVNIDTRAGTIAINGTGDGGADYGSTDGISATMVSNGTGKITINSGVITTANSTGRGIIAYASNNDSDIDITAHGAITGGRIGIEATNGFDDKDTPNFVAVRSGNIKITTNATIGAVGANNLDYGIVTRSGNGLIDINVGADIDADKSAIMAQIKGNGVVDIDISADAYGAVNGIEFNSISNDAINIDIASKGSVSGATNAISGIANGKVTLTNAGFIKGILSVFGSDASTSHFQNSGTWEAFGGSSLFVGSFTNAGTFNLQNGIANDSFSTRDFKLTNNSFLKIDVDNANRADSFDVTGTVALAGTLDVKANGLDKYYVRGEDYEYTLITNDGVDAVTGAFDAVETNFAFLTPTINTASGDGNDVTLSLHAKSDRPDFKPHAIDAEQLKVASAIDGISFDTDDGKEILNAVEGITTKQASEALKQFSGSDHTSSNAMGTQSFHAFNQISMARRGASQSIGGGDASTSAFGYAALGATKPAVVAIGDVSNDSTTSTQSRTEIWARMFASRASVNGNSTSPSLSSQNSGLAFGGDYKDAYLDAVMGISVGYSNSNFSTNVAGSSSKSENYHLGAYGFYGASASSQTGLGFLSAANFSRQNFTTKRALTIGGLDRMAIAKYRGDTYGADLRLRYGVNPIADNTNFVFAPIAGIDFSRSSNQSYTETGAGALNLISKETNTNRYGSQLGFEVSNNFQVNTMPGQASLSVGWHHELGDVTQISTYSFAGSPTQFTNAAPAQARDRFSLSGGVLFNISQNSTLSFSGSFENSKTSQQLGGGVTLKFKF